MGRRRRHRDEGLLVDIMNSCFELFQHTPFWLGPLMALGSFACFYWLLPRIFVKPEAIGASLYVLMFRLLACAVAGAVAVGWIGAEIRKLRSRKLYDNAASTGHVRDISWQDFEHLVGEHFRRQGYMAEVVGSPAGDGGIDVLLHGKGEQVLVQCKHWRAYKVSVREVRELHSVVVSGRANRGILITSGQFTGEARDYAQKTGIELIDGGALQQLLLHAESAAAIPTATAPRPARLTKSDALPSTPNTAPDAAPRCPRCGNAMVRRVARSGSNAGRPFWGCPAFPKCREIVNIA